MTIGSGGGLLPSGWHDVDQNAVTTGNRCGAMGGNCKRRKNAMNVQGGRIIVVNLTM